MTLGWGAAACAALLALAPACAAAPPPPASPDGEGRAPSMEEISSATFTGVAENPISLVEGRYEGLPPEEEADLRPVLELVTDLHAEGDLDGDGTPEAAVLLVGGPGESATNIYLAAVGIRGGAPINLGTELVGDRVQIRSLSVAGGRVHLALVTHAAGDAMCCPSRLVEKAWALDEGRLRQVASRHGGRLGLPALAGTQWILSRMEGHDPGAAQEPVTLTVDGNTLRGSAGCNQFTGTAASGGPGEISIGPLAVTRKGCPPGAMDLERAVLRALGGATRYGFSMGRLALEWEDEGAGGTLLFEPGAARPVDASD